MTEKIADRDRRELVSGASRTVATLGRVLDRILTALEDAPPGDAVAAKELFALVGAYQKAVQNVIDLEKSLARARQPSEGAGDGAGEIDLEGARREVLGKLARLAGEG